jgi:predicted transcriptional regulator
MASIKPPAVKAAVIAKSIAGESKTQIAEDLGITRNTVYSILDEAQLNELVLQGKSGLYSLIPKSVRALELALDKGDTTEAKIILRSVNVLPQENADNHNFSATVNLGVFGER